jgi:hypothetical protein
VNREYVCISFECLYKCECGLGVARKSRAEQMRSVYDQVPAYERLYIRLVNFGACVFECESCCPGSKYVMRLYEVVDVLVARGHVHDI